MNAGMGLMNNVENFNAGNMSGSTMNASGMSGGINGVGVSETHGSQMGPNVSLNGRKEEKNEFNKTSVTGSVNPSVNGNEKVQETEETGNDDGVVNAINVSDSDVDDADVHSGTAENVREVTVLEDNSEATIQITVPHTSSSAVCEQDSRQEGIDKEDGHSGKQTADELNTQQHTTPRERECEREGERELEQARQAGREEGLANLAKVVVTEAEEQTGLQAKPNSQTAENESSRPLAVTTGPTKLPRPVKSATEGPISPKVGSALGESELASNTVNSSVDSVNNAAPTASVNSSGTDETGEKKTEEKKNQSATPSSSQSTLDGGRMEGWQKARPKKVDEKQGARLSLGGKGDVAKKLGQLRASEGKKGGGDKGGKKKEGGNTGNVVTRSQAGGKK